MALNKGLKALREALSDDAVSAALERKEPSASDGVAAALHAIRAEAPLPNGGHYSPDEIVALTPPEPMSDEMVEAVAAVDAASAEQSKPAIASALPAPPLLVSGAEAIRVAGEATEADRVREYGLLAEIDAKITANGERGLQLVAVIETTEKTLAKANADMDAVSDEEAELKRQRSETVDRILRLNQATIDNEAARLRRGS